jgi:hypothetical protein
MIVYFIEFIKIVSYFTVTPPALPMVAKKIEISITTDSSSHALRRVIGVLVVCFVVVYFHLCWLYDVGLGNKI